MNELIDKLSKTCENCKYRGMLSLNYPCCDCLVHDQDNKGNLTGCVTFTKFCPIDATCIHNHNDVIHRYLDKLKENRLITDYDIQTMYIDDEPYCTDISLYRGKYVYSNAFGDISDQDLVIDILTECLIKIYRQMADDIMDKIKEEKHDKTADT